MPLSLSSYLLGVGTVVGALALGFGGGVLLTNTAMKDSPAGQTRIERVARSEPLPAARPQVAEPERAPQVANAAVTNPQENAPPPVASVQENAAPPAAQAPAANTDQAPVAQAPAGPPAAVPAARSETANPEPQRDAERSKEAAQAKPTEQAKQTEPREAEQGKTAERRPERQQRYAERRSRDMASRDVTVVRMKPRRLEVVDGPEQEVVSEPQQQPFGLFKLPDLFGRPDDRNQ